MSRQARQLSETGFYHVIFRGINHQHLFEEDADFQYLLQALKTLKKTMNFEIHAYCLMSNHVHLLMKEQEPGDISMIMKRILTKYAMYFNQKYQRSGALIASRYKSVPVKVDEYFITLIRYIHQNPLKANLVEKLEDYAFSSYWEYLHGSDWVNTELSLSMIGKNEWLELHRVLGDEAFEVSGQASLSDNQVRQKILQVTKGREPHEIVSWSKPERNAVIKQLKAAGVSIRQIERETGISRGIVARC
ncbi:transposase [Sporomusa termitida]|uniref:Transposase IS200 like protein n=1 Tax=Sporomusa termitida TaxID=2377 RepID=A0A517DUR3_9FIRM|nr:transposase [Sporomusa termitida]QDR81094.1 Transposase IS200 like protein [Sporomusa termitida]